MKIGVRKPSVKRSIKARTTGRAKRAVKSAIPGYGKKGMGYIKDPEKALYNKIYHKTTVGLPDAARVVLSDYDNDSSKTKYHEYERNSIYDELASYSPSPKAYKVTSILLIVVSVFMLLAGLLLVVSSVDSGYIVILVGILFFVVGIRYRKKSKK